MATSPIFKAPDPTIAKLKEVLALVGRRDFGAAEALARKLQQSQPDHADANNVLGIVLLSRKNAGAAVKFLEHAVRKQPDNAVYLNNLGCAYLDLGVIELAQAPLSKALKINPGLTKTLWLLGEFYRQGGKPEMALPYHEKACRNEPQNSDYKWALGKTFEMLGRSQEASAIFLALREHPQIGDQALYRLAVNDKHDLASPLLAEIETKLSSGPRPPRALSALHNGAGKIREQNGDFSGAFEHFIKANEADPVPFDIARYRAWVDGVIATFTPELLAAQQVGSSSDIPVFVVGMPRSGTTLVEQIIARHPQAAGAGELDRIWKFGRWLGYHDDAGKFIRQFDAKPAAEKAALAEQYIRLLRFFAPDARRVVDKLPHNFELLGLIALLFPKSRIVHMRRNAVDTCLSCFQNTLNAQHGYSRNLTTLGLYYREYARLMEHWRRVLPVKFIDVDYESLTRDFEAEARRLIDFLGLDWDPACLSFHEGTSGVRTFSRNQVRNPIYQSSVGRWRRYEAQLGPLVAALGDLAQ
ncbi:tetratricopeptide repeat-containing sulfotransferase family protein [Taklimakanibacter lacteus]|uniref:tetratricopeptide repeat-containing sulfotransferase family protein n=1 Tax=Taklimakanibacter lacteus TaxID=2268456 RepID=UPI000E666C01